MEYAQLNPNGTYSHQINTRGNVEWDATHFCPASALSPEEAVAFRVVPLQETPAPDFNPLTHECLRDGCELVGGQWQYRWSVAPLSVAQVEARRADAISARWEAIKAERDRRRFEGGVKVSDCWFKSDNQAVGEYTAMAMLGASMPGTTVLREAWRTMHPTTTIQMTPNLAKQILFAGFTSLGAMDDAALSHLSALTASANPAAYDFSSGWPQSYQDSIA